MGIVLLLCNQVIEGGTVTVTYPDITMYFTIISEAVQFVDPVEEIMKLL